ncbi:MAG: hypothetical protein HKN36_02430 [Hellea sp.]|nr:hypothetical protein [Hellea sp.]
MLRRALNLVLPPLMWLSSSMNLLTDSARSPADMSDANPSLLVPPGIAFSIWLPIFLFCIAYGVIQALPSQKKNVLFKRVGWWTAAGFAAVCGWGLINGFWPAASVQMVTAIWFVPSMLLLVRAMLRFQSAETETGITSWPSKIGISMIAGWCSIAVFLNWAPQTAAWLEQMSLSPVTASVVILAGALLWIGFIGFKSRGNGAYLFPPIWGLALLVYKRLNADPAYIPIVITAIIGIAALALIFIVMGRNRRAGVQRPLR